MNFKDLTAPWRQAIEQAIQQYLNEIKPQKEVTGLIELHRAIGYSLTSGGARYRPLLNLMTTEALGGDIQKSLPFAVALELVHTYSLIHDDLPAMDDDDFRRGQPANHKVFGESMAVLAGDALCTEPYRYLAEKYAGEPTLAIELIRILSLAAGPGGMVGGQAIDIFAKAEKHSEEDLQFLHECKTVALFRAAVSGAAAIAQIDLNRKEALDRYASRLGLLFQITDDIQDGPDDDGPSYLKTIGLEKARECCQNLAIQAIEEVQKQDRLFKLGQPEILVQFVKQILERTQDVPGKNK